MNFIYIIIQVYFLLLDENDFILSSLFNVLDKYISLKRIKIKVELKIFFFIYKNVSK